MIFAFFFAIILMLLAVFSIRRQLGNLRRMRSELRLPSDDRYYLRQQAYRRLMTGFLLIGLAGLLAGAYLSGMEQRAAVLGQNRAADENGQKPPAGQEEKDFFRFYSIYWIGVLVLLFLVVSLAVVDLVATRGYAWQQLRRIQSENRAMLERDLAMYRQQQLNQRMRGGD